MHEPAYDLPDEEARKWAVFCHLGGLAVLTSFPLAGIIVPLVIWLVKRETHPFVDHQGREALNFRISMALYVVAAVVALIVLTILIIGIFLWWLLPVLLVVQCGLAVVAAVKANQGEPFRYPITIRFV